MKRCGRIIKSCLLVLVLLCPVFAQAQGLGGSIYSLNNVLDKLFDEMLPLCDNLIAVGRAIAGFAALWYIAIRVWKHIARAEAIDFFPLLRPFAIGLGIAFFPFIIYLMNGVLKPIVTATEEMSKDSHNAIRYHIAAQEKELNRIQNMGPVGGTVGPDLSKYEQPDGNDDGGLLSAFSFFNVVKYFKIFISETVKVLYAAAALCVNTIRTFYLIVLAILGPLVFGLSVFDGFEHTLSSWFAKYVNIFMWLPVANIFGAISSKILENMMNLDQDFFSSTAYIIFMIISIVGYTTIPNVAGYIIKAGSNDTLLTKVTDMSKTAGKAAIGMK